MSSFEDRLYCKDKYKIVINSYEMRMSHWVDGPHIQRVSDNQTLLDCSNNLWSLDEVKEDGEDLVLSMRKYDGHRGSVEVRIIDGGKEYFFQGEKMSHAKLMDKMEQF